MMCQCGQCVASDMWFICVCAAVTLSACAYAQEDSVSVVTRVGNVRAHRADVNENTLQFLGIPYARVDDNDPFGAATPHPPFDIPYDAYNDPPICPQIVNGTPHGDIHCLHLNVFTPINATSSSTLPVMVFVHGGGFAGGNGNSKTMSPKYLVEKDVIVVTLNHRLGLYGFVCLPELGYSNQGLKDIILALKWIKNNINSFGGDENNILLFGHSAGSGAAEFLLLFNEDNVFNKVILQSTNIANPYLVRDSNNDIYVAEVAKSLGIDTKGSTTKDVMKQLSRVSPDLVINASKDHSYAPCIDDIFITRTPKAFNIADKLVMIGNTNKELLVRFRGDINSNLDMLQEGLDIGFENLPKDAVKKVRDFYLTGDVKDNMIDFGTDFCFNYPVERSVRYYVANNASVYRYVFSYDGGRNYIKLIANITEAGATHGDELGYLFDMDILTKVPFTDKDSKVSKAMTEMWTNFAKYGNPTAKLSNNVQYIWPKVDKESQNYMNISDTAIVSVQAPYHDRMAFWDMFYQLYGDKSTGFNFGEEYTRKKNSSSGLSLDVMRQMREFL